MLDLHRLQLLHRFAQLGSIAATAAALGYSPSAVSQQLATLERETGVALLDRTARSAELTVLGRRLADHATTVLAAVEAAEVDLATHAGSPWGEVRITAVPTAAVALAPTLAGLRTRHPGLVISLRQAPPAEAIRRLRARDSDLAIVDRFEEPATSPPAHTATARHLDSTTLLEDPFLLALPADHPLADHDPATVLSEAAPGPWICAPEGEPSRQVFDRVLSRAGIRADDRWEFEGLATIAALVAQGVGLSILPRLAVADHLAGHLALLPLLHPARRHIVALTRASSRRRPSIDATLTALQTHPAVPAHHDRAANGARNRAGDAGPPNLGEGLVTG